jgi:hypothetical protein
MLGFFAARALVDTHGWVKHDFTWSTIVPSKVTNARALVREIMTTQVITYCSRAARSSDMHTMGRGTNSRSAAML